MKSLKHLIFNGLAWFLGLGALTAQGASDKKLTEKSGKELFAQNCVLCHGEKGDGNGPAAKAMAAQAKPRDFTKGVFKFGNTPEKVFATISNGVPGTAMPSWKHIPEAERRKLTEFVLSLSKTQKPKK